MCDTWHTHSVISHTYVYRPIRIKSSTFPIPSSLLLAHCYSVCNRICTYVLLLLHQFKYACSYLGGYAYPLCRSGQLIMKWSSSLIVRHLCKYVSHSYHDVSMCVCVAFTVAKKHTAKNGRRIDLSVGLAITRPIDFSWNYLNILIKETLFFLPIADNTVFTLLFLLKHLLIEQLLN